MCLICVQYQSGKLKAEEALRNIGEMKSYIGEDHFKETVEFLNEEIEKEEWAQMVTDQNAPYEEFEEQDEDYYEQTGFGD